MLQEIRFRPLQIADLNDVQSLYQKSLSESVDPLSEIRVNERQLAWEMRRLRQSLLADQRYICWVAESDSGLVGYIAGVIESQASMFRIDTYVSVNEIYVEKAYRRSGIATELGRHLEEHSRALGISWIKMQCLVDNDELKAFFESLSYKTSVVEMRRRLDVGDGKPE